MDEDQDGSTVVLRGQEIHYVRVGRGPVIVLVHGILGSRRQWAKLVSMLAQHYTVIAPDLLGHGDSAKPRGDYSLSAHAATLRDVLDALGGSPVTVAGHSLGGGIAMQFAYTFPDRCIRLVLISSGGLGRELSVLLRAPTLPGAGLVLPVLGSPWLRRGGEMVGRSLRRVGVRSSADIDEIWRGFAGLGDVETRRAFLATIRTVIDRGGQTVSGVEKFAALAGTPVLIVWGGRDRLIPVQHGVLAHEALPGSRLEVFDNAGHFPHLDEPARFVRLIREFVPPSVRLGEDQPCSASFRPPPASASTPSAGGPPERRGVAEPGRGTGTFP